MPYKFLLSSLWKSGSKVNDSEGFFLGPGQLVDLLLVELECRCASNVAEEKIEESEIVFSPETQEEWGSG